MCDGGAGAPAKKRYGKKRRRKGMVCRTGKGGESAYFRGRRGGGWYPRKEGEGTIQKRENGGFISSIN